VILPNDPCYEIQKYKRPFIPGEISRVVMRAGIWRAESGGG